MAPSVVTQDSCQPDATLPSKVYTVKEAHFEAFLPPQPDGYKKAKSSAARGFNEPAIIIDNGSSAVRAGWTFEENPRFIVPPITARYRDRKIGRTYGFAGYDVYADTTARGHMRYAFEAGSGIVSNWDVMESVLDYVFLKLGIDGSNGSVDMPIVMTEAVANLSYSRKCMNEIIFELYCAPSLAYGIDSLFSYAENGGKTGLVVSSSHSSTHLIPVVNKRPLLTQATRLNWGGLQSAEFLLKLIRLKYPTFPGKLTVSQMETLVKEHCYISQDYEIELSRFLDWTGLEDRDHIVQYPFTEEVVIQKSEEELAKAAEKRKESGRRLQEQAAKMRLGKLVQKEEELEYYRGLQQRLATETKKEIKRLLDEEELRDEAALSKIIKELDTAIRKARTKDIGGPEVEEEQEVPSFELLDVPDDQLDEAGLKQKRHQRLMKSNHDARARAKAEKEKEKARVAEEQRLDTERRENDLEGWLAGRRAQRATMVQKLKERERLKADLGNRKSLASQIRMKSIANLASDNPTKKRRRGNDDDNFGANDDDWGVYRQIATGDANGSDDDEEEDLSVALKSLEADLLKYDPEFTDQHTLDAQTDWSKSLMHAFLRGPRPFDPSSQAQTHQLHLNVERIRIPEVIFQPSIAGLDQAGIVEIAADILTQRICGVNGISHDESLQDKILRDVFLTGGNSLFQGLDERLRAELRAVLPSGKRLEMRRAKNPILDAWSGAAGWVSGILPTMSNGVSSRGNNEYRKARVTREEFAEKGNDYIKEHDLGNAFA